MTLTTDTLTTDPTEIQESETAPSTNPLPVRKRSARVALGWAAVVASFAAAIILGVAVLLSGDSSTEPGRTSAVSTQRPAGIPTTPDAAERWLDTGRQSERPQGVPTTPDAAERWLSADDEER